MTPAAIPAVLGSFAGTAACRWELLPSLPDAAAVGTFAGAVASISVTMLGFMLAATTILASINGSHLVNMMRQYGHYHDLLLTFMSGSCFFLGCAVGGFALLFGAPASPLLLSGLIGLHVAAFASLIDTGRKLWLVLKNVGSDPS